MEKSSTDITHEQIKYNLEIIRSKVEEAKKASGQDRKVTIMAATKTVPAELINFAVNECGLTDIGENRVNELLQKYDEIDKEKVKIHFIGQLQKNKVKYIIDKVALIHSLDSVSLAAEIDRQAKKHGITSDVLVELNSGYEPGKGGVLPEDIFDFFDQITAFDSVRPVGIMTMAPLCKEKEEYRIFFDKTYRIFLDICTKKLHNIREPILSMGMSDNYDVAVECGSNLIRPGSAVFGRRK